jgi:flagellar FliL protein
MATEDATEKPEATPEAAPKKGGGGALKLVIILVAVAVVLGGAGAGAYFFLSGGKEAAEAKPQVEPEVPAEILNLELEPFLVNLADPGGSHYLKTTLTLELDDRGAADWINARLPRVRDRVLLLLSSKESAELLSAEGKFRLRDDVQRAINDMMGRTRVSAVYLTEFVVQ